MFIVDLLSMQVLLHNKFHKPTNCMAREYILKKNSIFILYNGVEIVVQYDSDVATHIDVLVRSEEKTYDEALDIVHNHVTKHIQDLRGEFNGCQGVVLLEGIVRKDCVEHQLDFTSRSDQAVLVEDLKKCILENGPSYEHTWPEVKEEKSHQFILNCSRFETAINMLGTEEKDDVRQRQSLASKRHEFHYHSYDQCDALIFCEFRSQGYDHVFIIIAFLRKFG
jgi:hypothetical protein